MSADLPQSISRVMRYALIHESIEGGSPEEVLFETQGEALVAALVMLESRIGIVRVMVKRVRKVEA